MSEKRIIDTRTITLCSMFAALTAIGAFIRIPTPVVSFTLQFLFVALGAIVLGAKRGALAQLIYVGVGLSGIPIFTKGGGLNYIFEPSFGYLIGFIVSAYVMGYLIENKQSSKFSFILMTTLIGTGVTYLFGASYMYMIFNLYLGQEMGVWTAVMTGAITFIPKDIVSCIVTSLVATQALPLLKRAQLV